MTDRRSTEGLTQYLPMKRLQTFVGLLVLCLLLCTGMACRQDAHSEAVPELNTAGGAAAGPDQAAVDKAIQRLISYDGCRDLTAQMRLTGTDASGRKDRIELRIERQFEGTVQRSFLSVLAPAEEIDKALLAIQTAGEPTTAFSYLPGLKKLAKLSSSRTVGFRGARVTVQELLGLELGQYNHEILGGAEENGRRVVKVVFTEKPDLGMAFPKIVAALDPETLVPVSFELQGTGGEVQKRILVEKTAEIESKLTLTRLVIEDLSQQLQLALEMDQVDYDRGLKTESFTEERLKRSVSAAAAKGR